LYYQIFWTIGLFLAILFVGLQYQGWLHLNDWEIFVHTNQSSSFFVMLVGAHALHVLGGIAALMTSWILSLRKSTKKWSEKGQLRLELTCTYWHFVDVLWLYLLFFLWFQQ
jgi:cytochrome c oxidase subunit 3